MPPAVLMRPGRGPGRSRFETRPLSTFIPPTGGGGSFPQDDQFNTGVTDPMWTEIDPPGDVTWSAQATTMRVSIPAFADHDWWNGVFTSAKLAQVVDPGWTDPLEVKLSSIPPTDPVADAEFGSGLFIDDGDYNDGIRCDILRMTDNNLHLFVGLIEFGGATTIINDTVSYTGDAYVRITRAGGTYTFWSSNDGSTWTDHGSVGWGGSPSRVGIHATTFQHESVYTQDFDYFLGVTPAGGGAVDLDGIGSAAASATGALDAERPLTTHADASSAATGVASVERPVSAVASAASGASGTLSVVRDIASIASASALASASMFARAVGLASHADAASDMDGSTDVARTLAGMSPVAVAATGTADVARPLSASASAASAATGVLAIQGQVTLSGSVSAASSASGALVRSVPLSAVASACVDASGALSVRDTTPALDGTASATGFAGASRVEVLRGLSVSAGVAASASADLSIGAAYVQATFGVEGSTVVDEVTGHSGQTSSMVDGTGLSETPRSVSSGGSGYVEGGATVIIQ